MWYRKRHVEEKFRYHIGFFRYHIGISDVVSVFPMWYRNFSATCLSDTTSEIISNRVSIFNFRPQYLNFKNSGHPTNLWMWSQIFAEINYSYPSLRGLKMPWISVLNSTRIWCSNSDLVGYHIWYPGLKFRAFSTSGVTGSRKIIRPNEFWNSVSFIFQSLRLSHCA